MPVVLLCLLQAAGLPPDAAYRLGPGDVIDIAVFEVEELSKPAVLAPDGTVHLPLIGAVELAGLTTHQAALRLRERYAQNLIRDPQIAVSVREYHSQPVTVLGAVVRPGVYQLRGPRPLRDVLALAEGLAPDAGGEITIVRGSRTFTIETARLLADDPGVEPHDTIRVTKAGLIYVVGEVGRAGGFPLREPQPVTVLKALSLAEGLRRTAAPQRSRIIRTAGGRRQEIPVRLGDVLAGRAADPALVPGDVLFVPHSQAKGAALRAAEAAVQVATGVIIWRR
jgi:polysaccharide export outer membrane protein